MVRSAEQENTRSVLILYCDFYIDRNMGEGKWDRTLVLATTAIFAVGVFAFIFFKVVQDPESITIDTTSQPTSGNRNAPIHIIVFEDLRCCNCKDFNEKIYPVLKRKYIDTGKAKYTYIALAFTKGSMTAANAALSVYRIHPLSFFPYLEKLHKIPIRDEEKWSSFAYLTRLAMELGNIDPYSLRICMRQNVCYEKLAQNLDLAKKAMGKNFGTPAMFINGSATSISSMTAIERMIKIKQKKRR